MSGIIEGIQSEADLLKDRGNLAFREGDFNKAVELFSQSLTLDSTNYKILTNRSLCYASLGKWSNSVADAKSAIALHPQYEKANFRLVKALIEMSKYKEARVSLLSALKECGETKDLKSLEELIFTRTHIALRPKSTDFEIVEELGDGNFSKVYKACHKLTKRNYAVKVV